MERDENYVPRTRSDYKLPPQGKARTADYEEIFEEMPLFTLGRMVLMQLLGMQSYLLRNSMGSPMYPPGTNVRRYCRANLCASQLMVLTPHSTSVLHHPYSNRTRGAELLPQTSDSASWPTSSVSSTTKSALQPFPGFILCLTSSVALSCFRTHNLTMSTEFSSPITVSFSNPVPDNRHGP